MITNLLQLRKEIDAQFATLLENKVEKDVLDYYWSRIKNVIFANQIIENHKIINFHVPKKYYEKLINASDENRFEIAYISFMEEYDILKSHTDDVLKQSKIKKILQYGQI